MRPRPGTFANEKIESWLTRSPKGGPVAEELKAKQVAEDPFEVLVDQDPDVLEHAGRRGR